MSLFDSAPQAPQQLSLENDVGQGKAGGKIFLGRAILNGQIRFLSVSQVVAFDPAQEGGCPRRWAFQKLFGKKEEETEAQRKGKEFAKSLEHYLKTGEDVLPPILLAGKHLLPKPGPDLEVEKDLAGSPERTLQAIKLRDAYFASEHAHGRKLIAEQIRHIAGLTACDVPFIGASDYRHRRGEFIDMDAILKREAPGMRVAEVGDHKTTARINDHTTRNGTFQAGYAKTVEQVLAHPQMVGYAVHASNIYPDLTHVRLSHNYYQTKGVATAAKRTGLITVEDARRTWETRIEPIVREMVDIARAAKKPEDVPTNLYSCVQFKRECVHAPYCDRPNMTVAHLFQIKTEPQGGSMSQSLFSQMNGVSPSPTVAQPPPPPPQAGTAETGAGTAPAPTSLFAQASSAALPPPPPPAPPPPPMSDAERQAIIEAERQRLMADDSQRLSGVDGYAPGQFCNGRGWYENQQTGVGFVPVEQGHRCPSCAPPQAVPHVGAINPPDSPPADPIAHAAPLPPETIAQLEDPVLKQKAEAHAAEAAKREAAETNKKEKASGRCSEGGKEITLTEHQKMARDIACPTCGKTWKGQARQKALKVTDSGVIWTVPKHESLKVESAAPPAETAQPTLPQMEPPPPPTPPVMMAPPPPPPPAVPQIAEGATATSMVATSPPAFAVPPLPPPPPPVPTVTAPPAPVIDPSFHTAPIAATVAPVAPAPKRTLYIDCVVDKGDAASLDPWLLDIVRTLEQRYKVDDIRLAPNDTELGYGRWKGALAVAVKYNLPPAGTYVIRGTATSEITSVVADELANFCDTVVRGVK